MKKLLTYFSPAEWLLWLCSVIAIILSFCLCKSTDYLTLSASLVGATSLIFNSKGNPAGQALMIVFSVIYGIISFGFAYYGEMLTYLGMTAPMAIFALISWLKNPFGGRRSQVKVNSVGWKEWCIMLAIAAAVTAAFYFILAAFNTANLIPSTISVTTSFVAVYLTARRSPFFALAYAANDVVLIILWVLASLDNPAYIPVVVCFSAFLINDIYCFINWQRIKRLQQALSAAQS